MFRRLHALDTASLSAIVMLVVTLSTFGIALIPGNSYLLDNKFMPGHAELYRMYDSSHQRLGHKVGLLVLCLGISLGIVTSIYRQESQARPSDSMRRLIEIILSSMGVLLLVAGAITIYELQPPAATVFYFLASLVITAVCTRYAATASKQAIRATVWSAIIVYAAYLIIPGFVTASRVPTYHLGTVQLHYGLVLGFADKLAVNPDYFARWLPQYGLLLPSVLGAYQHHFGLLNFGQHIRIIQASQIAFIAAALFAFYLWKPRKPITLLFPLVLFGAYLSTIHWGVFHPNQSGWRFIGFPVWVVLLILIRNFPPGSLPLLLGCSSGFFLLCNFETGVVLTFGSFLFFISGERLSRWRQTSSRAASFLIGAIFTLGAFDLLFRMEFGRWPFSTLSLTGYNLLNTFNSGYGGFPLKMDFLAIFIFMHCVYLVSSIGLRCHAGQITSTRVRIQFALASVILIWFAYYMNRPHPWNLWTFLFLYSFVVVDYLSMRRLSLLWRRRGLLTLLDMRMAVVIWLLLPNALYFNHSLIRYEIDYFRDAAEADLASISGITIPKAMVATLVEKVAFLETVRDRDTTIYLTGDSFIIPLMTKQFNPFSVQDVYLENFRADDFEHVVNDFKTSNAKYLLIDEPSSVLAATDSAATLRFEFFKKIMKRLAPQYREIGAQSDWRIWERTAPDLQPAHLSPT